MSDVFWIFNPSLLESLEVTFRINVKKIIAGKDDDDDDDKDDDENDAADDRDDDKDDK